MFPLIKIFYATYVHPGQFKLGLGKNAFFTDVLLKIPTFLWHERLIGIKLSLFFFVHNFKQQLSQ